jgi:hypothetical protein
LAEILQFRSPTKNADFEPTPPTVRATPNIPLFRHRSALDCLRLPRDDCAESRPAFALHLQPRDRCQLQIRSPWPPWARPLATRSGRVFNSYRVGDYFNSADLVPPRHRCYSKDEKEVAPICPHETIPIRVPRFQPIPLEPRAVRTLHPDAAARH